MCSEGLQSQCETTQVTSTGKGAALFGYTSLYGSVPGGQAEYLRVPQAQYGPIKVSQDGPDERYLFLSDILPTAWQAVQYANVPDGGTLAVFGLGPVGQFATRIGRHLGHRVIGIDPVPERRAMADRHGIETFDPDGIDDVPAALLEMTGGTARTAVIDAVGWRRMARPARPSASWPRRPRVCCRIAVARADRERRRRPADRAAQRDRCGAARRHRLDQRRLRRLGRPDADDGPVRQAGPLRMGQCNVKAGSPTCCRWSTTRPTRSGCST